MRRVLWGMVMVLTLWAGQWGVVAVQETAVREAPRAQSELIDLNTATGVELETLPGIGPRTAERILEYRREHGGFERLEDLMDVRGIGERTFLRLKPLVTVAAAEPDAGQRP